MYNLICKTDLILDQKKKQLGMSWEAAKIQPMFTTETFTERL